MIYTIMDEDWGASEDKQTLDKEEGAMIEVETSIRDLLMGAAN